MGEKWGSIPEIYREVCRRYEAKRKQDSSLRPLGFNEYDDAYVLHVRFPHHAHMAEIPDSELEGWMDNVVEKLCKRHSARRENLGT